MIHFGFWQRNKTIGLIASGLSALRHLSKESSLFFRQTEDLDIVRYAQQMTDKTQAVTGEYTSNGLPNDCTSITPHIVVENADAAIAFYEECFGAQTLSVTKIEDIVAHAVLAFPSGKITLSEPMDDFGLIAPSSESGVSYSFAIYVNNADASVALAVGKGAIVREPIMTFVNGDRFGSVVDPFNIRWTVMTRVEDLSPAEAKQRIDDWAANYQDTMSRESLGDD